MNIAVVIPALNEEEIIGHIVRRCQRVLARLDSGRIVVCDNNSRDRTVAVALEAGAEVTRARRNGYGTACRKGTSYLGSWPDVLVFLDADGSSCPEEIECLLEPIQADRADLVIGVRPSNSPMPPLQIWGNRLATRLINLRWNYSFADLGPFRAIRRGSYEELKMRDPTWGWTVEMQIRALLCNLRIEETPVSCKPRLAGVSKISGTVSGSVKAGVRILWTIFSHSLRKKIV